LQVSGTFGVRHVLSLSGTPVGARRG
jgi:hypothetical protein